MNYHEQPHQQQQRDDSGSQSTLMSSLSSLDALQRQLTARRIIHQSQLITTTTITRTTTNWSHALPDMCVTRLLAFMWMYHYYHLLPICPCR
jgi:hypothetical protein